MDTSKNYGFCFVWDETNGKKGSNEIGSCLLKYIFDLPDSVTHLRGFRDTCGGQNRNQFVCTALLFTVNKKTNLDIIDFKFMESGHSYLEYLVGRIVKKVSTTITNQKFNWIKIKWIRVEKSKPQIIQFKYNLDDSPFLEIDHKRLTDDEIANFLLVGDFSDIEELDEGYEVNVDNLDEVLALMTEEIEDIQEIQPPNNPLPDAQDRQELVFLQENENDNDLEYDWSNIPLGDSNWTNNTWTTSYPTCTSSLPDPPIENLSPLQYFKFFVDDNIFQNFVEQTNCYSCQVTGSSINTNISEMEQYIGIHFYMSIVKMPSYRMFWSRKTTFTMVSDTMSRNRFDKLRTYFHLNNMIIFCPGIMLTMINYFKFAHLLRLGIVHDFEIYVGKGTIQESHMGLGLSGDIVMRLLDCVPKFENHKVAFDSWFNSYALQCHSNFAGIQCIGTVRANRTGNCKFTSDGNMKVNGRGTYEYKVDTTNNIFGCKWFDNKFVHVLSNYMGAEPTDIVQRWSVSSKKYVPVVRPACIKEYNNFMGAINLHDMLVELYRTENKVKRYYLRIVHHLLDMYIAEGLLRAGKDKLKKQKGRPSLRTPTPPTKRRRLFAARPNEDVRFDNVDHWPNPTDERQRLNTSTFNVSPEMIQPIPKIPAKISRSSNSRRGKTAIITASPYKNDLGNSQILLYWIENESAGKDWFSNFLKRNSTLAIHQPEAISLSRAMDFKPFNVNMFMDKYESVLIKYKFEAHQVFNVDVTGITTVQNPGKVIAEKGKKQIGAITSAERGTLVTMCLAVSAVRNAIPPMFILPRVNYKDYFIRGGPPGCIGTANKSGWMQGEQLLMQHFTKHVRCTQENKVLVLLDDHESDLYLPVIDYCREVGIVLLSFPPHYSHKLQPLDRSVFGPFKKKINNEMDSWIKTNPGKRFSIYDVPSVTTNAIVNLATPKKHNK
ncbi:hypothetical protein AGLY_018033 [Aphis glycines]|uniref:DDE-1 domain-containing protein n=1 Tax=Aphis glycines TaxID=307491 RepID=A0A6G0STD4_APHGL|nr:hypothetical protein AGLY_018033 [Aphis glycines]